MRQAVRKVLAAALVTSLSGLSLAWSETASLGPTVHGHEFHRVALEADGCVLRYELRFTAPEARYQGADPRTPRFRFVGRIRLKSGERVRSAVFPNAAPGERRYKGSFDTTQAGCWAKDPQKVVGLDVRGCRGHGCVPEEFD